MRFTFGKEYKLGAILSVAALALSGMSATDAQALVISPMNTEGAAFVYAAQPEQGIACLRLRIDPADNVELLETIFAGGSWQDTRRQPIGPRFYFVVKDSSGLVLASGFRNDPRGMKPGNSKVEFLLTVPFQADTSTVELYRVSYESAGREDYDRQYRLLASFDISDNSYAKR